MKAASFEYTEVFDNRKTVSDPRPKITYAVSDGLAQPAMP
jgi:hypothetical protein